MFCTNCGQKLNDNVKFCTNCGTPIIKKDTINNRDRDIYTVNDNFTGYEEKTEKDDVDNYVDYNIVCPSCGTFLDYNPKQCPNCRIIFENGVAPIVKASDNTNNFSSKLQHIYGEENVYDGDRNGIPDIDERNAFLSRYRNKYTNKY